MTILSIWVSPACARAVEANPRYRQAMHCLDPLTMNNASYIRPGHQRSSIVRQELSEN